MFCFCFNAIPKPAPRRRCSKRTGSLPCWDRPLAGTSREIGSLLPKLHGPHRNDVGTGRAKAGPASLPCSPRTEGPPFSASSPRAPCPGQGCTPAPRGVAAPPQGCGARPPAALPAGSLRSLLQIRPHQSRRFSPRCLCGKEFSLGASHTHPGGCARSSGERSCGVATCHLWAERGNCSHVCLGVRMTPNQPLDRYACRALSASQNVLPQ